MAVLYVLVVLLAGNWCRGRARPGRRRLRRAYAAQFRLDALAVRRPQCALRCIMSFAAIGITTLLVRRNQAITAALAERARLLDLTHDTVSVRDMDNVIAYWNRGAEELYGWSRKEAVGKEMHGLLRIEYSRSLPAEIMDELLRTGSWEGELVHVARDGRQVDVASRWLLQRDSTGRPVSILETNNDIGHRKQMEAAAQRHQGELQLIIDWIPAPVWTSQPDRTADYVSARWEETGYSRADILADWRMVHSGGSGALQSARERSQDDRRTPRSSSIGCDARMGAIAGTSATKFPGGTKQA